MSHARTSRLQEIDIGSMFTKKGSGYGAGMERGMGHQSKIFLESEVKGQAPRHESLRVAHDHCLTKRHRLNKFTTFQQEA